VRQKCGCRMWETKNGDTEEYICPAHSGTATCHIADRECKHYKVESEDEAYCNHPDLDQDIVNEYCPIIVEEIIEEMTDGN